MVSRSGWRTAAWMGAAAFVLLALLAAPAGLRWLDRHHLHESIKDTWGRLWHGEDWATAPVLPAGLDYAWLQSAARPVLIAHALGEAGAPGQNTLAALRRSLDRGLERLEIDIWLDAQGVLRCHHGPAAPPPLQPGDCTLPAALEIAAGRQAWLVLDIKTDFRQTGDAIATLARGHAAASRLIFQLYRPQDVAMFRTWSSRLPLPGPIVTAYVAHRSIPHVAAHAERIGARALTVPLSRLTTLDTVSSRMTLFVHPIHNCEDAKRAGAARVQGLYLNNRLVSAGDVRCPA